MHVKLTNGFMTFWALIIFPNLISVAENIFLGWGGDAGNFYLTDNDVSCADLPRIKGVSTYIKKFHNQSRQAFYPVLLKA